MARYMESDRYIRLGDRPLIVVYRVTEVPFFERTATIWRDYCRSIGIGEIAIGMCETFELTFDNQPPSAFGCDFVIEFPTHRMGVLDSLPDLRRADDFKGCAWDYETLVREVARRSVPPYPRIRSVLVGWDNTPRKPLEGTALEHNTPGAFQAWLEWAIDRSIREQRPEHRAVFLIAWNEWGEGGYLEPDTDYGLDYLEAVRRATRKAATT
jgi:hypothetical protein